MMQHDNIIQSILTESYWLMEPDACQKFLHRVHGVDLNTDIHPELMSQFNASNTEAIKPYLITDRIATIPIHGPLIKRANGPIAWLLGLQGYEQISAKIETALKDTAVSGIFLSLDSSGGTVNGCQTLSDQIFNARGKKPILSFASGKMCSAAQWIGSAADYTAIENETTIVGSCGVMGVHVDASQMLEDKGLKPTVFKAGSLKDAGSPFKPLTAESTAYLQESFDKIHSIFLKDLARNLGIPVSKIDQGIKDARIFMGSDAVTVHLANSVMSREQAMQKLKSMVGPTKNYGGPSAKANDKGVKSMSSKYQNMGLLKIVETAKSYTETEGLSKFESDITSNIKMRIENADDWIEKGSAETLLRDTKSVIADHRKYLMSIPIFEKEQAEIALGRSVGKSKNT